MKESRRMATGEFSSNGADHSPNFDPTTELMLTLAMKQFSLGMYIPNADVLIIVNQKQQIRK